MKNISYVGKNEFGSFYDILTDDELMICVSTCEISVINGIKNPALSDLILSYAKNIFDKNIILETEYSIKIDMLDFNDLRYFFETLDKIL